MNREQKRAAKFKHGQRYTPHGTRVTENDLTHNRIAHALVRARIMDEVLQLRTRAGIHAYTGEDAAQVADAMGRLAFTVAHAAGLHGLGDTPEARILLGTANALADVVATPAALEQQRGAIVSGLAAIKRMLPDLSESALSAGALELQYLLQRGDLGTARIEQALRPGRCEVATSEACEA
jgi:hypothetical protein